MEKELMNAHYGRDENNRKRIIVAIEDWVE